MKDINLSLSSTQHRNPAAPGAGTRKPASSAKDSTTNKANPSFTEAYFMDSLRQGLDAFFIRLNLEPMSESPAASEALTSLFYDCSATHKKRAAIASNDVAVEWIRSKIAAGNDAGAGNVFIRAVLVSAPVVAFAESPESAELYEQLCELISENIGLARSSMKFLATTAVKKLSARDTDDLRQALDCMQPSTSPSLFWRSRERVRLQAINKLRSRYLYYLLVKETLQVRLLKMHSNRDFFGHFINLAAQSGGVEGGDNSLHFVKLILVTIIEVNLPIAKIDVVLNAAVRFLRNAAVKEIETGQSAWEIASRMVWGGGSTKAAAERRDKLIEKTASLVLDLFTLAEVMQLIVFYHRPRGPTGIAGSKVAFLEVVEQAVAYIISCLVVPEAILDSALRVCDAIGELYARAASLANERNREIVSDMAAAMIDSMVIRIVDLDTAQTKYGYGKQDAVRPRRCWAVLADILAKLEKASGSAADTRLLRDLIQEHIQRYLLVKADHMDELTLESIPPSFIIGITDTFPTETPTVRKLVLRMLHGLGGRLYSSCLRSLEQLKYVGVDAASSLDNVEILLDKHFGRILQDCVVYFSSSPSVRDSVKADKAVQLAITSYLEPIQALLDGIATQNAARRQLEYRQSARSQSPYYLQAFAHSIRLLLSRITDMRVYGTLVQSDLIPDLFSRVKTALVEQVFAAPAIGSCLEISLHVHVLLDPITISEPLALLEAHLFGDTTTKLTSVPDHAIFPSRRLSLYAAVASAYGERICSGFWNNLRKLHTSTRNEGYFVSHLLESLVRLLPSPDRKIARAGGGKGIGNENGISEVNFSFVVSALAIVEEHLRRNKFFPPANLSSLAKAFKFILGGGSEVSPVTLPPEHLNELLTWRGRIADILRQAMLALGDESLSRIEIIALSKSPEHLREFIVIAQHWELDTSFLTVDLFNDLLVDYEGALQEHKALADAVTFLAARGLVEDPGHLKSMIRLSAGGAATTQTQGRGNAGDGDDDNLTLRELRYINSDLRTMLGLDDDVLAALMAFSRDSEMFTARFDLQPRIGSGDLAAVVTNKTRGALRLLRDLVSTRDARINDFSLTLTGVIAELQNRRRSTIARELEKIVQFFAAERTGMSGSAAVNASSSASSYQTQSQGVGRYQVAPQANDNQRARFEETLANLNAAFSLLQYRDALESFQTALHELGLLPEPVVVAISDNQALRMLSDNFLISHAPRLLQDVQEALGQLSHWNLQIVGKLRSADLLMIFLRKNGNSLDEGALDRAQLRAAANAHASGVLMKLAPLQTLLQPFYDRTLGSLDEMRRHLDGRVSFSPDGKACITLAELASVSDNWGDVEIYFRDGGDSSNGSEDIQRIVETYVRTGRYLSYLGESAESSYLSFVYESDTGNQEVHPLTLQEHVQWAVLGGDVGTLEEFVESYNQACKAHAVRLELQEAGHPEHQMLRDHTATPLAANSRLAELTDIHNSYLRELDQWNRSLNAAYIACPRLLLLRHRSRVQFLMRLRKGGGGLLDTRSGMLAYVLQCFPLPSSLQIDTLTLIKNVITATLGNYNEKLQQGDGKGAVGSETVTETLCYAVELLNGIEASLRRSDQCREYFVGTGDDDGEVYSPTIVEVADQGQVTTKLDIYNHHLAGMLRDNYAPGQPGMVLWCTQSTSVTSVNDLLSIAQVYGLCRVIHVVEVNRLTPRVREVLLRGLQKSSPKCPVLLIFSSKDGLDAFGQFSSENSSDGADDTQKMDHSVLAKSLWALQPVSPAHNDKSNAEVWVVAGRSGSGKSRWITNRLLPSDDGDIDVARPPLKSLSFVVHEGFTIARVIKSIMKCKGNTVALHFHVTEFADLELFDRFLHNLFTLGLLIDEDTGQSARLKSDQNLLIYVELPEVLLNNTNEGGSVAKEGGQLSNSAAAASAGAGSASAPTGMAAGDISWPPVGDNWRARQHPFLNDLPALTTAVVAANHYISMREYAPLLIDPKAELVATYWLLKQTTPNWERSELPVQKRDDLLPNDAATAAALEDLFQQYGIGQSSKRVRHGFIELLYPKLVYFAMLHTLSNNQEYFELAERMQGSYEHILDSFIRESLCLAVDAHELRDDFVITICPDIDHENEGLCGFDIIETRTAGGAPRGYDEQGIADWRRQHMRRLPNTKELVLDAFQDHDARAGGWRGGDATISCSGVSRRLIPPEIRACTAPAFGISDSGDLVSTLQDFGHLLTPDSLVRLLHMHGRRSIGAPVIYEGETGVGKTQNLKLYSILINIDSALFTKLKLHLVAVLRELGRKKQISSGGGKGPGEEQLEEEEDDEESESIAALANVSHAQQHETRKVVAAVLNWVRFDARKRMNEVAAVVCRYFDNLFDCYPLHREGLYFKARGTFDRMQNILNTLKTLESSDGDDDGLISLAKDCEESAKTATFLPMRFQPPSASTASAVRAKESQTKRNKTATAAPDDAAGNGGSNSDSGNVHELVVREEPLNFFDNETELGDFLYELVTTGPAELYHRILADAGLTVTKWRSFVDQIKVSANRIKSMSEKATICVFVDELNTAGCLGLVSEAFASHSMDGERLPDNIFFVGAINPLRHSTILTRKATGYDFTGTGTVSTGPSTAAYGHSEDPHSVADDSSADMPYIVRALPPNVDRLKLTYPSLTDRTEEVFVREYVAMHMAIEPPHGILIDYWVAEIERPFIDIAVRMIVRAQNLVKSYNVPRVFMSIRNLIRATRLLRWLVNFSVPTKREADGKASNNMNIFLPPPLDYQFLCDSDAERIIFQARDRMRHALIMALSVTYMFQLPSEGHVASGHAPVDLRTQFVKEVTQTAGWSTSNDFDDKYSRKEWMDCVTNSTDHLFSYANIPTGLARTAALKENFYCIVLSAMTNTPLLITGPPGCGKTLSYNLACETLRGPCLNHTPAFQSLKKVKKIVYQCSSSSSATEIAAVYDNAHRQQLHLESGRHVCLVGLDEAGLPPANRQALKSLHDFLDMQEISTVMMSNATLDAAKTSRTLQILQTQANMEDLKALAWGLMVSERTRAAAETIQEGWRRQVEGFCAAYFAIDSSQVIPSEDNWFHSRDFIYACRMLRRLIDESGQILPTLFDTKMLLQVLRRHFQTPDPTKFSQLATHFLVYCGLVLPDADDGVVNPLVVDSLRQSISDKPDNPADPTSSHCRYTMVVDPTDSETAVDLLFTLKLLNRDRTDVITLSEFPEDAKPTRRTAVLAEIKKAIENGRTLLIVNSAPLQSALYDVINRHYVISVKDDGTADAFANIALGSFSRCVKVHPEFHLIIHLPASQRMMTPTPFLNRMEKYTLSVRDALAERISEVSLRPPVSLRSLATPEQRHRLLHALRDGVEHFVTYAGGTSSFYGMSGTETVSALILRALEDACINNNPDFELKRSVLATVIARAKIEDRLSPRSLPHRVEEGDNEDVGEEVLGEQGAAGGGRGSHPSYYNEDIILEDDGTSAANNLASGSLRSSSSRLSTRLRGLIRLLNFKIMESARVETIFRLRKRLPAVYMTEYIDRQEHLSCVNILSLLLKHSASTSSSVGAGSEEESPSAAAESLGLGGSGGGEVLIEGEKLVLYTRTDGHLLRIVTDGDYLRNFFSTSAGGNASTSAGASANAATAATGPRFQIITNCDIDGFEGTDVCVVPLSSFSNSKACKETLNACLRGIRPSILLIVADMKQVSASQVTFARHEIDAAITITMMRIEAEEQQEEERQHHNPDAGLHCFHTTTATHSSNNRCVIPHVIFLLHISAEQLQLRPCYQTIPLNGWSAIYVDAFSDRESVQVDEERSVNWEEEETRMVSVGQSGSSSGGSGGGGYRAVEWLRVAFSLTDTPTAGDMQREFHHITMQALSHAVTSLSFAQTALLSRGRRTGSGGAVASVIGVNLSKKAYQGNDKEWVLQTICSRSYLLKTMVLSFAKLWGQLLESTVQDACDRLVRGSTSRGLVACVRASHKWLLSDFMRAIVKRDLASNWGLEAIAALPDDSSHHLSPSLFDPKDGLSPSLFDPKESEKAKVALTTRLLRSTTVESFFLQQQGMAREEMKRINISNRVDCSKTSVAPQIPLYHSMMRQLKAVLQLALSLSRGRGGGASRKDGEDNYRHQSTSDDGQNQLEKDEATFKSLLSRRRRYRELYEAVQLIEGRPELWLAWTKDFIVQSLGFTQQHTTTSSAAIDVLIAIATRYAINAGPGNRDGGGGGMSQEGNLYRWLVLTKELSSELNAPSQLILACRAVYTEDDYAQLSATIQSSSTSSSGTALGVFEPLQLLLSISVQRLWEILTEGGEHSGQATAAASSASAPSSGTAGKDVVQVAQWMQVMRDVLSIEALDAATILGGRQVAGDQAVLSAEWVPIYTALVTAYHLLGTAAATELQFHDIALAARRAAYGGGVAPVDPLTSVMMILMAAVSRANAYTAPGGGGRMADSQVVSRMSIACFTWLLRAPYVAVYSTSIQAVIAGLLGAYEAAHSDYLFSSEEDREVFKQIFNSLSLVSRCEILKVVVSLESDEIDGLIEAILRCSYCPGGKVYVPYMVEAAVADSFHSNPVFARDNEGIIPAPDPSYIRFQGRNTTSSSRSTEGFGRVADYTSLAEIDVSSPALATHNIMFRTLFLAALEKHSPLSLERAAQAFELANTPAILTRYNILGQIKRAVSAVHLLNLASDVLTAVVGAGRGTGTGTAGEPDIPELFGGSGRVLSAVVQAISIAPRAFSTYLYCRLPDLTKAAVSQHKGLLEHLRMPWWCIGLVDATALAVGVVLSERDALARIESQREAYEKMKVALYASARAKYLQSRDLLSPVDLETMLKHAKTAQNTPLSPLQASAARFVEYFVGSDLSDSLSANVHIPALVSMYAFVRDKFAYRFESVEEARAILISDAIQTLLPAEDHSLGFQLLHKFIVSWRSLADQFGTFDICGREVRAGADIPIVDPTNLRVGDLVELGDSNLGVFDSLPARMLQSRLLKLTGEVLYNDILVQLRADDEFNRHEHLTEKTVKSACSVSSIPHSSPNRVLLTGCQDSAERISALRSIVASNMSWVTVDRRTATIADTTTVPQQQAVRQPVNFDELLRLTREDMGRQLQQQAHDEGWVICPDCGFIGQRYAGCEHVSCGRPLDPYGNQLQQEVMRGCCGRRLEVNENRVPAPQANTPPLPRFIPAEGTAVLPASLIGRELPQLPAIQAPAGRLEFDWVAIAAHVMFTSVNGRLKLEVDKDFFSPLQFASPQLLQLASTEDLFIAVDDGAAAAAYHDDDAPPSSPHPLYHSDSVGSATDSTAAGAAGGGKSSSVLIRHLPDAQVADVYTRLRIIADHIDCELQRVTAAAIDVDGQQEVAGTTSTAISPPVSMSVSMPLSPQDERRLKDFIAKQSETQRESISEQVLFLCTGILALNDRHQLYGTGTDYADVFSEELTAEEKDAGQQSPLLALTISDLMAQIDPPLSTSATATAAAGNRTNNGGQWSPLLKSLIGRFPARSLCDVARCLASAGSDYFTSSFCHLNTALPDERRELLRIIQKQLVDTTIVSGGANDYVMSQKTQLQNLCTLLMTDMETISAYNDHAKITDVQNLYAFVSEKENDLAMRMVRGLQVKHTGELVRYLRHTIGLLNYHTLSTEYTATSATVAGAAVEAGVAPTIRPNESSYKGKNVLEGSAAAAAATVSPSCPPGGLSLTEVVSGVGVGANDGAPIMYRELVPSDWEALQELPASGLAAEFTLSAPALREDRIAKEIEEENKRLGLGTPDSSSSSGSSSDAPIGVVAATTWIHNSEEEEEEPAPADEEGGEVESISATVTPTVAVISSSFSSEEHGQDQQAAAVPQEQSLSLTIASPSQSVVVVDAPQDVSQRASSISAATLPPPLRPPVPPTVPAKEEEEDDDSGFEFISAAGGGDAGSSDSVSSSSSLLGLSMSMSMITIDSNTLDAFLALPPLPPPYEPASSSAPAVEIGSLTVSGVSGEDGSSTVSDHIDIRAAAEDSHIITVPCVAVAPKSGADKYDGQTTVTTTAATAAAGTTTTTASTSSFCKDIWDIISSPQSVAMVDGDDGKAKLLQIVEEEYGATDASDVLSFTRDELLRIAALFKQAKRRRIEKAVDELVKVRALDF